MANTAEQIRVWRNLRAWASLEKQYAKALRDIAANKKLDAAKRARLSAKYGALHTKSVRMVALRRTQLAALKTAPPATKVIVKRTPPPTPMRLRALAVARHLVGVMEQGGNNSGPEVTKIIRANGGTGPEPWCGDFVAWAYRHAGSKVVTRAWALVTNLGRLTGMAKRNRRSLQPGDILIFHFPTGYHTGLLVRYCNESGHEMPAATATHVETIEGNTGIAGSVSDSTHGGDGVRIKIRPISEVEYGARVTR